MSTSVLGFAALLVATIYLQDSAHSGEIDDLPTLEIAIVGPLTSSSNSFGIPILQSSTLAIDQHNDFHENKKILSFDYTDSEESKTRFLVKALIYDDKSNEKVATEIISEIERSDAVAVLGPANSSVAYAIEEKLRSDDNNLPVISPLATATELTDRTHRWSDKTHRWYNFFRANVPDNIRLSKLINNLFDNKPSTRNLVLLYEQNDVYGEGMLRDTRLLLSKVPDFSMSRVMSIPFSRNLQEADAEVIADEISSMGSGLKNDAILLFGITRDAIKIIKALNKKNIDSQVYFNEPDETEFKAAADQNTDLKNVKIVSIYYSESPLVNDFVTDFRQRFDQEPSKAAAIAYDATRLLLKAVDIALAEGSPSPRMDMEALQKRKVIDELRKRIGDTLSSNKASDIQFVVPGQHMFHEGEFHHLQFSRLVYDHNGSLVAKKIPEEPAAYIKPIPALSAFFFSFWPLFAIAACIYVTSYIGSVVREYSDDKDRKIKIILTSFTSLIVDPFIAVVISLVGLLALFIFKPDIFEIIKGSFIASFAATAAVGVFAGFSGVRSFVALLSLLGIKLPDKPEPAK